MSTKYLTKMDSEWFAGKMSRSRLKISYAKGSSEVGQLNTVNKLQKRHLTILNVSESKNQIKFPGMVFLLLCQVKVES